MRVAKLMVDHALQNGWDKINGGFYDEGYYFKNKKDITIIKDTKNWWAQAEGLNTLLLMVDLFPNDPMQYFEKFKMMWQYIQTYYSTARNLLEKDLPSVTRCSNLPPAPTSFCWPLLL